VKIVIHISRPGQILLFPTMSLWFCLVYMLDIMDTC